MSESNLFRSETVDVLYGALAKAQGQMKTPQKKKKAKVQMRAEKGGGTFEYSYADLADIMEAITPALSANSLCLIQRIDAEKCQLVTILGHASGQWISCSYDLPRGLPAQQFGSALTYARRYSVCALLGVVAEDDDDVQAAQPYTQRKVQQTKMAPALKPKTGQVLNGTSGPQLTPVPNGLGRDAIMQTISDLYQPLMVLEKNLDLSAELMARYGATNRKALSDEEAFDFMRYMETKLKQGAAQ